VGGHEEDGDAVLVGDPVQGDALVVEGGEGEEREAGSVAVADPPGDGEP